MRAAVAATLPAICWRCGQVIAPGDDWVLGHRTDVALGGSGGPLAPEHRRCSDSSGAIAGNRARAERAAANRGLAAHLAKPRRAPGRA